jgi:hypothetical protein
MAKSLFDQVTRTLATADGKSDSRRRLIQAVRAAARRIGLDDEDRREIQVEVTGKASMGDMNAAELGRVLDRLNRGWKGPSGHRAHVGKVRALWWTLYWLRAVEQPSDRAIDAFVKRQAGVDALRFLDHRQAHAVIEALKAWAAREGVVWPLKSELTADREAVAAAIWHRLVQAAPVGNTGLRAFVAAGVGFDLDEPWDSRLWDEAIRFLGKRLRRERGRS